jgi:hypothetical protein
VNLTEAYNDMQVIIEKKFDEKKAVKALEDILTAYAQAKYVGTTKDIHKRWDDMWYTTYTTWFSSDDMRERGLPTSLKIGK